MKVNERFQNAVLGCSLKNDKVISVCFQGKPFNIRVIQVCAPIKNANEAEIEWFDEDLHDLLELTLKKKKKCPFHHRDWNAKVGIQETPGVNRQVWPWNAKANRVLPGENTDHNKYPLPTH